MTSKFKHIVLSGGGILACAHIGFIQALNELSLIDPEGLQIHGTSAGTIIGLMFILGMSPQEMFTEISSWTTSAMISLTHIHELDIYYGMDNGEYMTAKIMDLLFSRGFSHTETLSSLYEKTKVGFNITVTNIVTLKSEVWNHETYPDIPVAEAIRTSSSIPLLFSPNRRGKSVYVDGGIRDNYPVPCHIPLDTVVGCELVSWKQSDVTSFESYIVSVLSCLMLQQTDIHRAIATVSIDCSDMTYFNFDISIDERKMLYERGYQEALKRLSRAIS